MKLHRIALAACALASSQAFALSAADTAAAPVKLYITGSSALQAVIEGLLNQPGNCVSGTYTKYKGKAGTNAGSGDTTDGNSHNAYSCTLAAGNDFGSTFNGQNVAVIKREAGGSAQGVFPLYSASSAAPTATVALIDLTSCNDGDKTCSNTANVVPDAGVSDLEPVAFNSVANQPTAFAGQTVANAGYRSVTSVAEQVFALIANDYLYNDLITLTGSASVPKAAFASVFGSGYNVALGWTIFGRNASSSPAAFLPGSTNQVNICSRAIGSGTRATAQVQFLDLPYNAYPAFAAVPGDNTPGASRGGNTPGAFFISEESSSGNVVGCVAAANGSNGYSIGIVGADRDLTGTGTHFLSIDNVAPGRAAGREGQYQWVYESFYNVSKKVSSTSTSLFPNAFGAAFKLAKNINAVSAAAQNGVMATPVNCSGASASAWTGDELAACSRVSRNKDSRQPLTFTK